MMRFSDRKMSASGLLLLAFLWASATASQQVPLLMWASESNLWKNQPMPNSGHITTDIQLGQYLEPAILSGPKNVLLFLQEKLSIEDFTAFGGVYGNKQDSVFPNLESVMESSPSSLVLPAVDWYAANVLPTYLKEKLGSNPLHVDQSTLLELRLNASIPSLLIIRLPYASNSGLMAAKDVLRTNDEVIGQVLSTLKSEGVPYIALLTAFRPSRVIRESAFAVGDIRRQLLASSQTSPTYPPVMFNGTGNTPCILFWAKNVTVFVNNTEINLTDKTFNNSDVTLTGSQCDSTNATLVLSYRNVLNGQPLTLTFTLDSLWYKVSARHWFNLRHVRMDFNNQNATFLAPQISAPSIYSFHCQYASSKAAFGPLLLLNASKEFPALNWQLHIQEFQIQAFNVTGVNFSYASDCAGFFSPGIWMGLITTLLFVFILTYGLHMVMNLKTMDRFDDPKGPSISVPQTE